MKSILAVLALCSGLVGSYAKADIQIDVSVDLNALVCAILPPELQGSCGQDLSYGETDEGALRVCQGLFPPSENRRCYQSIVGGFYSKSALRVCSGMFPGSATVDCMQAIRNGYFQENAIRACSSVFPPSDQKDCMNTIKNKTYSNAEVSACSREFPPSNEVFCLKTFGRPVNWYERTQSARVQIPVVQIPVVTYGGTCQVSNSSSYQGSIASSQFIPYARKFAREKNNLWLHLKLV